MSGKRKLSIGIISSYPPQKMWNGRLHIFWQRTAKKYFKVIQECVS